MKENQEAEAKSEAAPFSMRAQDSSMKETVRKHGAAFGLATVLLASYALVLTSISDLRADLRTEFEKVDARLYEVDARLYELTERVARIEGHLALTRPSAAKAATAPALAVERASRHSVLQDHAWSE